MAITIINSPPSNGISEVGNCIQWTINMTGLTSGNSTSRFGYQLKMKSGAEITQPESLTPKEGVNFTLNFEKDIIPFLHTNPPNYNGFTVFGASRSEPEMLIVIELHYWEIVHDSVSCETIQSLPTVDGPYSVMNAASNWFSKIRTLSPSILTYKPKRMHVSPLTQDFIYFKADSGSTINATIYGGIGNVIGDRQSSIPAGINSIGIGPGNIYSLLGGYPEGSPRNVTHIKVWIDTWFEMTYIIDCGIDSFDLYSHAPQGGYTVMNMERKSMQMKTKYKEVSRYQPSCESYDILALQKGGKTMINKESLQYITFTKILDNEDEKDIFYYESFLAGGNYYVSVPWENSQNAGGERQTIKFFPSAGSLRYYETEKVTILTITGKIPKMFNLPNSEI